MESIPTAIWVAAAAHHLHEHWHTLAPRDLEAAARELLQRPELADLPPSEAVAQWLTPVGTNTTPGGAR